VTRTTLIDMQLWEFSDHVRLSRFNVNLQPQKKINVGLNFKIPAVIKQDLTLSEARLKQELAESKAELHKLTLIPLTWNIW
jgi:hypothetical protein